MHKSEAAIRYEIKHFTKFSKGNKQRFSRCVYVGGFPWKILAMPRVNNKTEKRRCLGFFLQANADSDSPSWSCSAQAVLKVISQKTGIANHERKISHTFCPKEDDWGYSQYMPFDQLMNPENGFFKDDTVILEVYVTADAPLGGVQAEAERKRNMDGDLKYVQLRERLYVVLHGKSCKIRRPSCIMGEKCIEGALQAEHLKKCRNEECQDINCCQNRKLLTHWQNCTLDETHCHICPRLSFSKQSYDISDLVLSSTIAVKNNKNQDWKNAVTYKCRSRIISKFIFASLNVAECLDKFSAALLESEAFDFAGAKKDYKKKIACIIREFNRKATVATYTRINIKKVELSMPIISTINNQKAISKDNEISHNMFYINDYFVRTIPKGPRQLYMKSFSTISDFRHRVVLNQVIFESNGKAVIYKVLERLESGCMASKSMINFIIDEMAKKIYICICAQKDQDEHINCNCLIIDKIEIKEFDFKFEQETGNGQRKIVSVTERKKSQVTVDLGLDGVRSMQLMILPFDGSFVLSVTRPSNNLLEETFGYLYKKKKTDRVLFFSPTKSFTDFQKPRKSHILDTRSNNLHVLYYTPQKKIGQITFKTDQKSNVCMNGIFITKYNNAIDIYNLLPVEARKVLYRNCHHPKYQPYPENYFIPLGFVYKLFFFRILNVLVGMKRPKDSLTLVGNSEDIQILITIPYDPNPKFMAFFCGLNLILYSNFTNSEHIRTGPKIRKIPMSTKKYAPKLKGYRTCAFCNKMETKKRKNAKGQRIADFQVCRECKKRKLHLKSPSISCYYCSIECLRSHWPIHKQQHLPPVLVECNE